MSVGGELHRLLESGDYHACLAQGRSLLACELLSEADRVRVLLTLCRCHLALGDLMGAVAPGEEAVTLARSLGLRDLEGAALLDLATALAGLRRLPQALTALERFRQGLPEYTASQCLEGAALRQTAEVMARMGRPADAVDWYQHAGHWFRRFGDEQTAGECLLGIIDTALDAGDLAATERWLAEADRHPLGDPASTGRLILARARFYQLVGQPQASADEAFRALLVAENPSRLQVQAHLHLSRVAEAMDRPVEALGFAFAARVSAIDARLYPLEFEAVALLVRLIHRYGMTSVHELGVELERQGVDLYQYLERAELERLARGE